VASFSTSRLPGAALGGGVRPAAAAAALQHRGRRKQIWQVAREML
jgi:hypothetical protein